MDPKAPGGVVGTSSAYYVFTYPARSAVFFVTPSWQPPAPESGYLPWVAECASRFLEFGPRTFTEFDVHDVQAIVAVAGVFNRGLATSWVQNSWA